MREAARVRVAWGIWAALAAAWLAPLASGYFLADDFSMLAKFASSDAKGGLWSEAIATFARGQTAGLSHFYRPLPFATFTACYAMFGAHASPWLVVNLAAHLGCAFLVAVLALELHADRTLRSHVAALAGATVFLCFAPGIEAAAWVAARYDGFATFFCLLACIAFLRSRTAWDRWSWVSLAAFVGAMLSKETAAMVPAAVAVLALWRRRAEPLASRARIAIALREAAPWIVLGIVYLVLRTAIFGSTFVVYGQEKPGLFLLEPQRWIAFFASMPAWFSGQVWVHGPRIALEVLLGLLALASVAAVSFDRNARPAVLAALALTIISLLQFAPHVAGLPADGSAGRLFHLTGAFLGVFAGVVGASRIGRGAALAFVLALSIAVVATGTRTRDRWLATEASMQGIAREIAQIHEHAGAGEYELLLLPSTLATMPFGVHAQEGLMVPPVQQAAVTDRLLVQEDAEAAGIAGGFARGIIANLRHLRLDELGPRGVEAPPEYPTRVRCFAPRSARLTVLPPAADSSPAAWTEATLAAMRAAGCA